MHAPVKSLQEEHPVKQLTHLVSFKKKPSAHPKHFV